jgi:Fe-S-cluster containining protein
MKLPVLPPTVTGDPSPCFGCPTACCFEYVVPINGHDLWRLTRALAVPWSALVSVRTTPDDWGESFTLHRGGARHSLLLRKRAGGGCALLMTVGQDHRCGVHEARPLACRVYPLHSAWRAPTGVDFLSHALCPPPQRARFEAQKGQLADSVVAELHERTLYLRVVARWDEAAAQQPREQPFTVDDYVRWTLLVYDALAPLRQSGPRATWQAQALALVSRMALPFEWAPGC